MTIPPQPVDDRVYAALNDGAVIARPDPPAAVLKLTGDDAAEFLQGQLTNDVQALAPSAGVYAAMLTPKGGMRADMRVLHTDDALLLITDADRLAAVRSMIDTFRIGYRFETADLSDDLAILTLAGPRARDLAAAALGAGALPAERENDNAAEGDLLAITTLLGVDLLGPPAALDDAERRLTAVGAVFAGADALELARIERGIPRYGFEIGERTIPEEAGLNERAVSFTKGCYVGQETVARLHYKGKPNRLLRGLSLDAPVAPGAVVTAADGRELGAVGGVAVSPARGAIALAILRHEAQVGDTVSVDGVAARVTAPGGEF